MRKHRINFILYGNKKLIPTAIIIA